MGVVVQGGGRRIGHFAGRRLFRDMATHPTGFFGLLIVVVLLAIAISAPLLAPYDDATQDIAPGSRAPPPITHLAQMISGGTYCRASSLVAV